MTRHLSRRGFLTGSAAAVGSVALWRLFSGRALAANGTSPTRVIFWYVPEGCAQQALWPARGPGPLDINMQARVGGGLTPESRGNSINGYRSQAMGTYCLQPLKAYESELTLISGLRVIQGSGDSHKAAVSASLTGGRPNEGSLDQWLGDHLQGDAPFSAIFSSHYGEHVAFGIGADYACPFRTKAGRAASPSWNPVTTYNQVFPNGIDTVPQGPDHRLRSRLRVMGAVRSRLDDVRCRGGVAARERLEGYLDSVERIESETGALIDQDGNAPPIDVGVDVSEDWRDIDPNRKYWHDPRNFAALARIQIDTTVAALALDRTRVSLMQFSASGSHRGLAGVHYKHIGLTDLEPGDVNDHYLGHEPDSVRRRNQARIFRWYYGQLAYLIDRLKSIPDGGGTLYDHTLIVCCSEFGSYNHRSNDVPYLLVGNPGGAFRKGIYLDAHNGNHRSHSDLLLAIARGLGMPIDRFGSSSTPYNDILA